MSQCLVFRAFFPLSTGWRSHGGRGKRRRSGSRWSKVEDEELTTQKADCALLVSPGVLSLRPSPRAPRRSSISQRHQTPRVEPQAPWQFGRPVTRHNGATWGSRLTHPSSVRTLETSCPLVLFVPVRAEDQDRVQSN